MQLKNSYNTFVFESCQKYVACEGECKMLFAAIINKL